MFDLGSEYETTKIPADDVATIQVISDGWHEGEPIRKSMMMVVEFVVCPMAGECQLARDGVCANTKVSPERRPCPWATCKTIRSKKHSKEMMDEIRLHPSFERLAPVQSRRFAVIGDHAYMNLRFKHRSDTTMGYVLGDTMGLVNERWHNLDFGLPVPLHGLTGVVPLSSLTPDAISRIVAGDGFDEMLRYGGLFRKEDYDRVVFQLLTDIRRCWPEGYKAFSDRFPRYEHLPASSIGRYAKAGTCRDGASFGSGESAIRKHGDYLETSGYSAYIQALGTSVRGVTLRIGITDRLIVKITDENQVDPMSTVFV